MSIMVSISCITYNHEQFIAQALEGFLNQQVDFGYEILIHDDASTDCTADIIRDYTKKYPGLIKPVLQTENQYSKGTRVGAVYNLPRAKGKYIAFCEGDDFWTDTGKLQKQVDLMESRSGYGLCFHAVDVVDQDGRPSGIAVRPYHCSQNVPIEDIIRGVGEYHRTCSLLARAVLLKNLPKFYFQAPAGDLALILYLASQGSVYYIDEAMSAYRSGVTGSWTGRLNESTEQQVKVRTGLLQMFAEFDQFTGYKYAQIVAQRQHRTRFLISLAQGNIKDLRSPEYKKYRDEISRYLLAKVYLKRHFPATYRYLQRSYDGIGQLWQRILSHRTNS